MFFEICLIQKLTLFLGFPTYSLTVTLMALLLLVVIASGAFYRFLSMTLGFGVVLVALFGALCFDYLSYELP